MVRWVWEETVDYGFENGATSVADELVPLLRLYPEVERTAVGPADARMEKKHSPHGRQRYVVSPVVIKNTRMFVDVGDHNARNRLTKASDDLLLLQDLGHVSWSAIVGQDLDPISLGGRVEGGVRTTIAECRESFDEEVELLPCDIELFEEVVVVFGQLDDIQERRTRIVISKIFFESILGYFIRSILHDFVLAVADVVRQIFRSLRFPLLNRHLESISKFSRGRR